MHNLRLTAPLGVLAAGLLFLVVGCGAGASGGASGVTAAAQQSGPPQVVHATASDFTWKLDKTTLSAGTPVQFDVTSSEGIHGFSIVGTKINKTVSQGKNEQIVWMPPKPGQYIVRCSVYCGTGHQTMFTRITVK